jgi:hypothetical protein
VHALGRILAFFPCRFSRFADVSLTDSEKAPARQNIQIGIAEKTDLARPVSVTCFTLTNLARSVSAVAAWTLARDTFRTRRTGIAEGLLLHAEIAAESHDWLTRQRVQILIAERPALAISICCTTLPVWNISRSVRAVRARTAPGLAFLIIVAAVTRSPLGLADVAA